MRAFVFPGQGAQVIGMGRDLAEAYPAARAVFDAVDAALGQSLSALIWDGDIAELTLTRNAQPALMATSIAAMRALEVEGVPVTSAAFVAGHSLGEYSALCAAGSLTLEDTAWLLRRRGQAMQEVVPVGEGAMAALLGLDDAAVVAACGEAAQGQVVEAVNFNAPSQVVIAGHKPAVERGMAAAKARGAKRAVMLPVSAPFHSSLLKPAAERLAAYLGKVAVKAPRIPVVNNVDVSTENDPSRIKDALARQACSPVRWVEVVRSLAAAGVTHVAECGPGKVLAGLTRRIDGNLHGHAIVDPQSLEQALQALKS